MLDMDGTLLDLAFDNYVWRDLVPRRYAAANGMTKVFAMIEMQHDGYRRVIRYLPHPADDRLMTVVSDCLGGYLDDDGRIDFLCRHDHRFHGRVVDGIERRDRIAVIPGFGEHGTEANECHPFLLQPGEGCDELFNGRGKATRCNIRYIRAAINTGRRDER